MGRGSYLQLWEVAKARGFDVGLFANSKRLTVLRVSDGQEELTQSIVRGRVDEAAERLVAKLIAR